MKKYRKIAKMLFELELDVITRETPLLFDMNEWDRDYGKKSREFVDDLEVKKEDVDTLALIIAQDFDNGIWEPEKDGSLYHPDMVCFYTNFITERISLQLAILTGIGYQTEFEFD